MADSISTYLSNVAADYTAVELSLTPTDVMQFLCVKDQKVLYNGSDIFRAIPLNTMVNFEILLSFGNITPDEGGTVMSMWCDSAKANGRENTFYFQHPTDGNTYTVRFNSEITHVRHTHPLVSVTNVSLLAIGNKP